MANLFGEAFRRSLLIMRVMHDGAEVVPTETDSFSAQRHVASRKGT
jgi:hypothetical protein